jgi:SAM-dependent methyltransferase
MLKIEDFSILRCPCPEKAPLINYCNYLKCEKSNCIHSNKKFFFPIINEIPILISEFNCDTVCEVNKYNHNNEFYINRSNSKFGNFFRKFLYGSNKTTLINSIKFIENIRLNNLDSEKKLILVIGSSTKGLDTNYLWTDEFNIVGIDIYPTETTTLIADAHYLPFADNIFDGVWIQAVLEHTVNPQVVVSEIRRVLKKNGVVYAETPFMQQVHEGAYDFQRFSVVGHRYLFRNFKAICIGGNQGPGVALAWSIKYFIWGLSRSQKFAIFFSIPFYFLLRILDRFCDPRIMFDGPSGSYFLGLKADREITHKEALLVYSGFQ